MQTICFYRDIDRIIYSQDVFYTLSKAMIKASDMNSLNQISTLELQDNNYPTRSIDYGNYLIEE